MTYCIVKQRITAKDPPELAQHLQRVSLDEFLHIEGSYHVVWMHMNDFRNEQIPADVQRQFRDRVRTTGGRLLFFTAGAEGWSGKFLGESVDVYPWGEIANHLDSPDTIPARAFLWALLILCEAFLLIHAASAGGEHEATVDPVVEPLRDPLPDGIAALALRQIVSQPRWWRDALDSTAPESAIALLDRIELVFGPGLSKSSLGSLLTAIFGEEEVRADKVEAAYHYFREISPESAPGRIGCPKSHAPESELSRTWNAQAPPGQPVPASCTSLVVGEPIVARALVHVLRLFHGSSDAVAQVEDHRSELESYRRIIYFAGGTDPAVSALRFLYRVRDDLTWTGGLVVVVPSQRHKVELDEMVLAEGPSSRTIFSLTPGHASVARPGVVTGVLYAMCEISSLPYGTWLRIQDASKTSDLLRLLSAMEGSLSRGEIVDHTTLTALVNTFGSIDWRPLLIDPHRDLGRVATVRKQMEEVMMASNPDPATLATIVREFLAFTWLRSRT
ncbi:MAG TPA: hypothetical protein VGO40_22540 [Longimicrobium sp.]|jgi:hypothetical protein|nr:hypothetical protein [Longimicrobium sp.]